MSELFYIASLKYTHKADSAICLWRAGCNGYCWYKNWAGIYTKREAAHILDYEAVLVDKVTADTLMQSVYYDCEDRIVLPNTPEVIKELNLNADLFFAEHRSCYMGVIPTPKNNSQ